jgi:hypothetical protein
MFEIPTLVVYVTVTSTRKKTDLPRIGARLPLPGSLSLGAQHSKLDADLRTSASLGTPSVHSVDDYYPFALKDGGRLAPMALELVDRMTISVAVRRFPRMGAAYSRSLRSDIYVRMSVCNISFVALLMFLFGVFWGMCGENSCNVFLLLFMVFWVPISAALYRRAVLMLRHAFLFLGLRFSFLLLFTWWSPLLFSCKNTFFRFRPLRRRNLYLISVADARKVH